MRVFDFSMRSAVLLAVSKWEDGSMDAGRDYFHSGCTGNAERQLPVVGSQFSVEMWRVHGGQGLLYSGAHENY
jgi:hypothetical protein